MGATLLRRPRPIGGSPAMSDFERELPSWCRCARLPDVTLCGCHRPDGFFRSLALFAVPGHQRKMQAIGHGDIRRVRPTQPEIGGE